MGYKKDNDNLDNPTKREILQYIRSNPGAHFTKILSDLGLKNGTLSYHLYKLEKGGYIKSVFQGSYKKFYPSGTKDIPKSVDELIYNVVLQNPGISQPELIELLGLSRQLVYYHIRRLAKKGIIISRKNGRHLHLYASYL